MRFALVAFVVLLIACPPVENPVEDTPLPFVDSDGDGVGDDEDACPNDFTQWSDADGDTYCDEVDDACPDDPAGHIDRDSDGVCAPTDECPSDPGGTEDRDGDGICDYQDDCPADPTGSSDPDGDGHCEGTDDCPFNPLEHTDTDGDGTCDGEDDCPEDAGGWVDSNLDGLCNGDDDRDGDGLPDREEEQYGADCSVSDPDDADTDGDEVNDGLDPYPRDPWREYLLLRNDLGTIDVVISNRDGTFSDPLEIGLPFGDTTNTAYRYVSFLISDFDNDGRTDFIAVGNDNDDATDHDLWWFYRDADEVLFEQRLLGQWAVNPLEIVADADSDELPDLLDLVLTRPGYITNANLNSYMNQGLMDSATCFATPDPTNPSGCAFVTLEGEDLDSWGAGQWSAKASRDAVDVDDDGHVDLALFTISSGGNSPVPVTITYGNGDGTFTHDPNVLFRHNSGACGDSPANAMVFGDFDGNGVGDLVLGLDDDGDPGSAWFYPGVFTQEGFSFDTSGCLEAFDLNTADETGSDRPGSSGSTRSTDIDFDGFPDVLVGFSYAQAWGGPSRTELWMANGDGTFSGPTIVGPQPAAVSGHNFAVPQRLCKRFPTGQ
jgi:hypothetical protein